tara:strand:- start:691 stop:1362 length:672 start_codon:yes stop_codon:yes gene_type:complete
MFYHLIKYDIEKYNFQKILCDEFDVDDLNLLHNNLNSDYIPKDGIGGLSNDTHSKFHNSFYKKLNSGWKEFDNTWSLFLIDIIKPFFKNESEIIYQSYPSFRIQYPKSKAVTTWHCDNDKNHQHPIDEINIMVPVTKMFSTNAVWRESLPGLGDFSPMELDIGDVAIWNGNRCRHGNKPNDTGLTRISFDFRVLPAVSYDENYSAGSATTGKKFIVGEYYSKI